MPQTDVPEPDVPPNDLQYWIESLLGPNADRIAAGTTLQRIGSLDPGYLDSLIEILADQAEMLDQSDTAIMGGLCMAIQKVAAAKLSCGATLESLDADAVQRIAESLPPDVPNRFRLLYLLAASRTEESLSELANQLASTPPQSWTEVGQVLSPLMQNSDWQTSAFFPAAFDALPHPSVAAPLLDLANFVFRQGRASTHPAAERRQSLVILLGAVVGRLAKFEEQPRSLGDSVEEVQAVLAEAVALAVALCDAIGQIGSEDASGKLFQALELRHRRVQCEAAGALARLGIAEGRERLIALAAEPSARLRAIAYAEELGFDSAIDEIYRTNEARAEADMALWLSQPANMGVPPTSVELIDQRLQYWPSFDQPIDCYLVRFEYHFGDRVYSNVGITGPAVFSVGADVADLPTDDIYAIYAGWQAEHEEIFTVPAESWNSAQRRLASPLLDLLDRQGFEQIEPKLLCFFLDEHALVVQAERHDTRCLAITDGLETLDFSTQGRIRPMTQDDIWYLYLGRKMLRTFNS